jgi:hypothetical protein
MDLKKLEVARLLNTLKYARGNEKDVQMANLLAELGVISDTPQAKAQWRNQ